MRLVKEINKTKVILATNKIKEFNQQQKSQLIT
jgi:hypothetical protein